MCIVFKFEIYFVYLDWLKDYHVDWKKEIKHNPIKRLNIIYFMHFNEKSLAEEA